MQTQLKIRQPEDDLVREIQQHLNCHPITATVLANRGLTSGELADRFMRPKLNQLPSPWELKGMRAATERISLALQREEKILIFGDYDADGVTAASLLTLFLKAAGGRVETHLPHRIEEGYGLQPKHINQLAAPAGINLIITVDCGSSSQQAITAAQRFGIDVVVTDHHNVNDPPEAFAVINPKLPGQPVALADLAGVGVAFYLAIGLRMALREHGWWEGRKEPNLKQWSDLVAIGTIADMVPLTGVNRILAKTGMDQLNTHPRPGLAALCKASGIRSAPISSDDISYRLTPRINAAGRMAHAGIAMELLNVTEPDTARRLAETLNQLNSRRQSIERDIFSRIAKQLEGRPDLRERKTLLLADPSWHEGVLGIVAAKLTARFHLPVILLASGDELAKGSGRSIPSIDLFQAVSQCADLLEKFGGHHQAAGLTVQTRNIGKLQNAFEQAVLDITPAGDTTPCLPVDAEIHLNQITPQLVNELEAIAPFGETNPPPLFLARELRVVSAAIVGKYHRRMTLVQPGQNGRPVDAIQFNLAPDTPRPNSFGQLAFHVQWNRYNGQKKIQLVVEST